MNNATKINWKNVFLGVLFSIVAMSVIIFVFYIITVWLPAEKNKEINRRLDKIERYLREQGKL